MGLFDALTDRAMTRAADAEKRYAAHIGKMKNYYPKQEKPMPEWPVHAEEPVEQKEYDALKQADDMVERAKKIRHERLREEVAIKLFTTGVMRDTANGVRTLSEVCERARTIAHQAIQFTDVFVDTYMEHEAKNDG